VSEVSFDIAPGSFVTVTGPTGAGKTTLLDCMLGLRPIASGRVMIDGVSLDALSMEQWRRSIGYLGQDPMMFHATIEENLKWIKPESTMDEIAEALRRASAEFVYKLPNGLETIVGDAGGRLSGGERQRLALARALLGSPRLLVLDEATSSLDGETEAELSAAILTMKGKVTIVMIAHRLVTVKNADLVVYMDKGKIVASGSFAEIRELVPDFDRQAGIMGL
jgi:ATP-binding cassette subfamily C protein